MHLVASVCPCVCLYSPVFDCLQLCCPTAICPLCMVKLYIYQSEITGDCAKPVDHGANLLKMVSARSWPLQMDSKHSAFLNPNPNNSLINALSQKQINGCIKVVHHRCQAIAFMFNGGSCSSFTFYPIDTENIWLTVDLRATIALKRMPLRQLLCITLRRQSTISLDQTDRC